MIRVIRYEADKLAPGSILKVIGFGVFIVALGVLGSSVDLLKQIDSGAIDPDLGQRLAVTNGFAGLLFATLVGAAVATKEHTHATLHQTAILIPSRPTILVAKGIVSMGLGLLVGIVSSGTAVLITTVAFRRAGYNLALTGDTRMAIAGTILVCVLSGPWGLAIGSLIRNGVAAVVAVVAYTLVVETLLIELVPSVGRFIPGGAQAAIIRDLEFDERLGMTTGVVLFSAFVLGALGLAVARFDREQVA